MDEEAPLDAAARVAAAAAHSFNNHIAAISLQAELALAGQPSDESVRRRLQGILDACEDARALARGLLAFGGRRLLAARRVDLVEAVRRAAGPADVRAGAERVFVEADPSVLAEALAELAAAAEADEPVTVAVESGSAVVRFAAGRTVAGDDSRGLFEPFVSEEQPLGLAAVYGFARQSGGAVALETDGEAMALALRLPHTGG